MNLWDQLLTGLRAQLTRWEQPATRRIFHVGRTTGGEVVNEDTALRQSVVWGCLAFLSRTVAQLPWRVMGAGDGGEKEQVAHPVSRLLKVRPNPEMGPFSFKETLTWWAASYGNAVAEIQFDQRNVPVALWPLHPSRVGFSRDRVSGRLQYEVTSEGAERVILAPEQVFHLRGYGDGPVGLNVIAYAAESIGWARATEVFGSAYFGQGMSPSGVIVTKGVLKGEGLKALKNEVAALHEGTKNAHRTLFLDGDMEFKPLAVTPATAQLIETRQHQVEEICRWFGVPPHKVMHLLRATFSNIEHQAIEVVVDSITPWCIRLEEEANYKLFGLNRQGLFTKLDLKGLLRGDYKSRQEGLQIMRRNGIINADEWRALEDMNPIGGEQGSKYIVEGNMTTLEKVGEAPEPAAAPASVPAPVEDDDEDDAAESQRLEDRANLVRWMEAVTTVASREPAPLPAPVDFAPLVAAVRDGIASIPPPIVHVAAAEVHVPAPVVNVMPPVVHVEAPQVSLEANLPKSEPFDFGPLAQAVRDAIAGMPAPIVNVTPPAVNVAAPVVHVAVPEAPVPQVTVRVPPEGEKEQIVKRDNKGEIISILTRRVSERR